MTAFRSYKKKTLIMAKKMPRDFTVPTLEGSMKGKKGDYLAIGIKGEYYPIKKEIFEQTYEEAKR